MKKKLARLISRVKSYREARKLVSVLHLYRKRCRTENEAVLLKCISEQGYEKAVILYAAALTGDGISPAVKEFAVEPCITTLMLSAKPRYWEFFIDLHGEQICGESTRFFYGDNKQEIVSVRRTLLSGKSSNHQNKNGNFFTSRLQEWQSLFPDTTVPKTGKKELMDGFDDTAIGTDEQLFQAINTFAPQYFFRKLVLPSMLPFLFISEIIAKRFHSRSLRVLDYGCGCGDLGLFCALLGHKTTACEVEGVMLGSVIKRFNSRSIRAKFTGATAAKPIPKIKGMFELVIAREVLEHVRDPIRLLDMLNNVLTEDGCVVLGSFPFRTAAAVGDHLVEAISAREIILDWIEDHWQPLECSNKGYAFCRK